MNIIHVVQGLNAQSGERHSDSVQPKREGAGFLSHVEEAQSKDASTPPSDTLQDVDGAAENDPNASDSQRQDVDKVESENREDDTGDLEATDGQTSLLPSAPEAKNRPQQRTELTLSGSGQIPDSDAHVAEGHAVGAEVNVQPSADSAVETSDLAASETPSLTEVPNAQPSSAVSDADTVSLSDASLVGTSSAGGLGTDATGTQRGDLSWGRAAQAAQVENAQMVQAPKTAAAGQAASHNLTAEQAKLLAEAAVQKGTSAANAGQSSAANITSSMAALAAATGQTPAPATAVPDRRPVAPNAATAPVWSNPTQQMSAATAPVGSGLMAATGNTAALASAAAHLGISLTGNGANDTASDSGPQSGSLPVSAERAADTIALPQMLTEASVRAGGAVAQRHGTPQLIASQLAEAAMQGKQKIDVVLNPQELGNVTMRLSTTEAGIAMMIQAERPETEELMRRHIHELAKEFKEMGFENVEFSFSGGGADQSEDETSTGAQSGSSLLEGDVLDETEEDAGLIGGHLNVTADVLDVRV